MKILTVPKNIQVGDFVRHESPNGGIFTDIIIKVENGVYTTLCKDTFTEQDIPSEAKRERPM